MPANHMPATARAESARPEPNGATMSEPAPAGVPRTDLTRTVDGRLVPAVGTWRFEAGNSSVEFTVKHMMISRVRGSFRAFTGTIEVADVPTDSRVSADIEAASIDTGMAFRDRDLRSADFLDVEQHPQLTFRSTAVRADGDEWVVTGDLTIASTTRPVDLAMEFQGAAIDPWGNAKAVFSASTQIEREDWGLTYNRAIEGGGVLIGSTVKISMEIQAKPAKSD
jgi:polyisoprenoid-binding protein YceI